METATTSPASTPGPYHVETWRDGNGWACYQIEGVSETDAEAEGNARLFAAAPELLGSCREADAIIHYLLASTSSRAPKRPSGCG